MKIEYKCPERCFLCGAKGYFGEITDNGSKMRMITCAYCFSPAIVAWSIILKWAVNKKKAVFKGFKEVGKGT